MSWDRATAGALTHAELVDLVVRQAAREEERDAALAALQARVADLEAQNRELQRQLTQAQKNDPTGKMPGLKPAKTPRHRKDGPRDPRSHGFSRRRDPAPTETVVHAVAVCPDCGSPLAGGTESWRKEVLDLLPVSPARVIHHVYLERRCPNPRCGRRVRPPRATAAELGVPQVRQRLGGELLARLALLRTELRLPIELIQWYLQAVHGLELSAGALVAALQRVAAAGAATVQQIQAALQQSPVVHADETGLRQDGTNGYLWSFSTPREQVYVHGRRTKDMVDAVLGPAFVGVLCTDFFAAYDHYPGPHQRCWAHLLRASHDLKEQFPQNTDLQAWTAQVHGVYERACRWTTGPHSPEQRVGQQRRYEAELLQVCAPSLHATKAEVPQAVLCRRIEKYLLELFTFVADPRVPSTNTTAERQVRPVVVQRKISGGTRSAEGTRTFCTLATLFGTWRLRNLDPLVACRTLLQAQAASTSV